MIGGDALVRLRSRFEGRVLDGRVCRRGRRDSAGASAVEPDLLTGLLTHAGLVQAWRSLGNAADAAVVVLDLDQFRNVNTAFSRPAGDHVLRVMVTRLRASVPEDALLARVGDDEFAIVLPRGGEASGRALAELLAGQIGLPVEIDDETVALSASIGVTGVWRGESLDDALRRADTATAHAKEQDPGERVRPYHPEMVSAVQDRFALEGELRQALATGQFRLHYQPLVDLATNVTTEVEALIRWQHPARGLLLPGEFLPGAEAAGLMREIGRWVLREACTQGKQWQDALNGRRVVMAVNLSPGQFRDPGLLEDIAAILDDTGFDPTLLRLEISESVTQDDIEPAVTLMQRARALGVRLALDDFGAGYAGWTFIQRCPIDAIKIDRSLLADQPGMAVDRSRMVEAILAFARHLGVPVSVEGVERADQAFTMRALGVPTAQGFYFSYPQPPHLIAPMLAGVPLQPIPAA